MPTLSPKPFQIVPRTKEIEQLLTGPSMREALLGTIKTKTVVFVPEGTRSIDALRSEMSKWAKTNNATPHLIKTVKGDGYYAWLTGGKTPRFVPVEAPTTRLDQIPLGGE